MLLLVAFGIGNIIIIFVGFVLLAELLKLNRAAHNYTQYHELSQTTSSI